MEVDEPLTKEWIIRSDHDANVYSNVPTTLRAMSQTRSMMSKTNAFLRQFSTKNAMKAINTDSAKVLDDLHANR